MKLGSTALAVIVLLFSFGGIGTAISLNFWKSTPYKAMILSGQNGNQHMTTPDSDGNNADASTQVRITTPYHPKNIRGTYTFSEISQMFNIPLDELGNAFGLTSLPDFPSLKARELKAIYTDLGDGIKMETESVRIFISMYVDKPYAHSHTAYLPIPAVNILKANATLSKEQLAFLDTHTIDISRFQKEDIAPRELSNQPTVTGETSFQKLLDWGVSQEEIEIVIGQKLPTLNTRIRDYAMQNGKDFLTIMAVLQEKVNDTNQNP